MISSTTSGSFSIYTFFDNNIKYLKTLVSSVSANVSVTADFATFSVV